MPLQDIDFFGNLPFSPLDPSGTDSRTISDDQHRNIIASLNRQAPNWTGVINATHEDINTLIGLAANGTKPMPGVGGLTVLYFYNVNTPPPGWGLLTPDANIRQLIIGDAVNGGTIGGTTDPVDGTYPLSVSLSDVSLSTNASNTQNESEHTHTGGSHNHQWYVSTGAGTDNDETFNSSGAQRALNRIQKTSAASEIIKNVDPPSPSGADAIGNGYTSNNAAGTTSAGTAHNHGIGSLSGSLNNGASTGTLQVSPRYASGILGTLNA